MQLGRCVAENRGELGCHADVVDIFDDLCSGKQNCNILVGSNNMGTRSTCSTYLVQYLQAKYQCRKGMHGVLIINIVVEFV